MAQQEEIVLWIDRRWKNAIAIKQKKPQAVKKFSKNDQKCSVLFGTIVFSRQMR